MNTSTYKTKYTICSSILIYSSANLFSIIALSVKTNSREVRKWDQPIISDHSTSINGFLLKNINNTNHYLLQVVQEPGFNFPKFTSTICIKNYNLNKHYKNTLCTLAMI